MVTKPGRARVCWIPGLRRPILERPVRSGRDKQHARRDLPGDARRAHDLPRAPQAGDGRGLEMVVGPGAVWSPPMKPLANLNSFFWWACSCAIYPTRIVNSSRMRILSVRLECWIVPRSRWSSKDDQQEGNEIP